MRGVLISAGGSTLMGLAAALMAVVSAGCGPASPPPVAAADHASVSERISSPGASWGADIRGGGAGDIVQYTAGAFDALRGDDLGVEGVLGVNGCNAGDIADPILAIGTAGHTGRALEFGPDLISDELPPIKLSDLERHGLGVGGLAPINSTADDARAWRPPGLGDTLLGGTRQTGGSSR